jgi:protein arginine N-methyltransferase 1
MEKKTSQQESSFDPYEVKKTTEENFDLKTCFEIKSNETDYYLKDEDYYFDSYSHFSIHEDMLKDKVRTNGYMNAITKNPQLFEDKIVLDVGCGTGILSIFAAQAGAKHVYGIENASIARNAVEIIKDNKLSSKITVIKGKVEEITLPVDKVDIIISEWMGYFLLYESMFDCVLFARDKWLKPDGMMFPDRAALFIASIEDEEYKNQKINFWENVYGVNMSSIKKWALAEPLVDYVDRKSINSEACQIYNVDLKTVKKEELDFASAYKLKVIRNDYVHALVSWFEVYFSHCHIPVRISTSPFSKETHWKQTVFYLENFIPVKKNDELYGSIAVRKCKENARELDIKISYHLENKGGKAFNKIQYYKLT